MGTPKGMQHKTTILPASSTKTTNYSATQPCQIYHVFEDFSTLVRIARFLLRDFQTKKADAKCAWDYLKS